MSVAKIAVSIDQTELRKIDFFVKKHIFKSRSQAFQMAIHLALHQLEHDRFAEECAKFDPHFEQEMADIGLSEDLASWSEY